MTPIPILGETLEITDYKYIDRVMNNKKDSKLETSKTLGLTPCYSTNFSKSLSR